MTLAMTGWLSGDAPAGAAPAHAARAGSAAARRMAERTREDTRSTPVRRYRERAAARVRGFDTRRPANRAPGSGVAAGRAVLRATAGGCRPAPAGGSRSRGYFAFINATVVSSIRFEKPHSLSYQDETLTRRPETFVSVESKIDERASWLKSLETSGSAL